eukprot:TRINITY_DN6077_c0_g1_i1.p1 TRINITY_DN6077_c0_g1~~TRINITY_DN6077_c0_g1_i1.p1  ORF type:complete len:287 (-),score=102.75 TRINITY_DN6077_c0_g1_i1:51-911(-)
MQETRKNYIDTDRYFESLKGREGSNFSDKDRDEIDHEIKRGTQRCLSQIQKFQEEISKTSSNSSSNQFLLHLNGIVGFLGVKLQETTFIFSEQRAERFKRMNQPKNGILKLPSVPHHSVKSNHSFSSSSSFRERRKERIEEDESNPNQKRRDSKGEKPIKESKISFFEDERSKEESRTYDEAELRLLEEENDILAKDLETSLDQTRQVEESVMEISKLMETFVSKLSEQSEVIETNHQLAVGAKSHIDKGTKELRRAARWSVDFRVFVLLFLLVASFSLLFLHHIT